MLQRTYIIAVSGGVDSVVLLHKLVAAQNQKLKTKNPITYVVAHLDHGIRSDSASDAQFVEALAKHYSLEFVSERAELQQGVSEEEARDTRYDFLFRVAKKHHAEAIVTAHHQDDIIETIILHVGRGTSPRGLIGYTRSGILRPLMHKTKQEIIDYAQEHELEWREDSTNTDERYTRNYIRLNIIPKLSTEAIASLLSLREGVERNYLEIDRLIKVFHMQIVKDDCIQRSQFVVLPFVVQKEIIASLLRQKSIMFDRKTVEKAVLGIKTLEVDKHLELKKNVRLYSKPGQVLLKVGGDGV